MQHHIDSIYDSMIDDVKYIKTIRILNGLIRKWRKF